MELAPQHAICLGHGLGFGINRWHLCIVHGFTPDGFCHSFDRSIVSSAHHVLSVCLLFYFFMFLWIRHYNHKPPSTCRPVLYHCVVILYGTLDTGMDSILLFEKRFLLCVSHFAFEHLFNVYYFWWAASIQPRLLFSSCRLCFSRTVLQEMICKLIHVHWFGLSTNIAAKKV